MSRVANAQSWWRLSLLTGTLLLHWAGDALAQTAPSERLEQRGNTQWHVLRQDGREYVRFDDIKTFYRFETLDIVGDELVLESAKGAISLRFRKDSSQAHINRYLCHLSFPPVQYQRRLYLSRTDLALLVDPTIRPARMEKDIADTPVVVVDIPQRSSDAKTKEIGQHLIRGLEAFDMKAVPTFPEESAAQQKVLAMIQLREAADTEALQTLTLIPSGTQPHRKAPPPASPDAAPGNAQDRLNVALGMALHATLMETVEGILDGGLRRDDHAFLKEAAAPAVAIAIPAQAEAPAEVIGASLVRGLRRFHQAVSRP